MTREACRERYRSLMALARQHYRDGLRTGMPIADVVRQWDRESGDAIRADFAWQDGLTLREIQDALHG